MAVKYKRLDGESDDALILRVTNDKDLIGSWQDVANILNELLSKQCKPDTYRKIRQNFDNMYRAYDNKEIGLDDQIHEIEVKKRELEQERCKLQTTNIEYKRNLRHHSRFAMFYENVAKSLNCVDVPKFRDLPKQETDMEYILTISDIHAGAKFITGTNQYSFEIIQDRFNILLNHIITFVTEKQLNKLKVLNIGDNIQNILRISDLQLNESSTVYATVFVAKIIAQFLNDLSQYVLIDYYHVPSANHSQIRLLNTKASELATEDIEYVISNYIKDVLSNNKRIQIHTNFGYDYIEIPFFDYTAIALHGHTINNLESSLKDLSFHKKKFYTNIFLGHFHASKCLSVGQIGSMDQSVLVCPSFVGDCPYAEKILKGVKAASCIFGFTKKYGCTETYKIILN